MNTRKRGRADVSRRVVLILGAPRSGTSVVAHALHSLGVDFGDFAKFVDPKDSPHNPIFFELVRLNEINDAVFEYFGTRWNRFDFLPSENDFDENCIATFELDIRNFLEVAFDQSVLIGLKDPRFCFTLPLWRQTLSRLGWRTDFVLVERQPAAVLASNLRVNGQSSLDNFRLANQSVLAARYFLRNTAHAAVDYDQLLDDPSATISALSERLGLESPLAEEAARAVRQELRHFNHTNQNSSTFVFFCRDRSVPPASREGAEVDYLSYREIYLAATRDKSIAIDRLQAEIATTQTLLQQQRSELQACDRDLRSLREELNDAVERLARAGEEERRLRETCASLLTERDGLRLRSEQSEREAARLSDVIARQKQQLSDAESQVACYRQDATVVRGLLDEARNVWQKQRLGLEQVLAERDAEIRRLLEIKAEAEASIAKLQKRATEQDTKNNELKEAKTQVEHFFAVLEQERNALAAELERQRVDTQNVHAVLNEVLNSTAWKITYPMRHIVTWVRCAGRRAAYGLARYHYRVSILAARIQNYRRVHGVVATMRKSVSKIYRIRRVSLFGSLKPVQHETETKHSKSRRLRAVTFVVNSYDLSTQRYRVHNLCEEFFVSSIAASVIHEAKLSSFDPRTTDLLVLCRIAWTPLVEEAVYRARTAGIPVVFDIDDLIFEPEKVSYIRAFENHSDSERRQLVDGIWRFRRSLVSADSVTCSTSALAREIASLGKTVHVVPNSINQAQRELARDLRQRPRGKNGGPLKIGYFSGTRSHEVDFEEVREALLTILDTYKNVEFHVVGELDLPEAFERLNGRVVRKPLMGYLPMLEYLSRMDINLAPLEMENPFTAGKSELKIFEAALVGVPTVASGVESYAACIRDGLDGFLARNKSEWIAKIARLIEDDALRKRMGQRAAEDIAPAFDNRKVARIAADTYTRIFADYRRPAKVEREPMHESGSEEWLELTIPPHNLVHAGEITGDVAVVQRLVPGMRELTALGVSFATFARENTSRVEVMLADKRGRVICKEDIAAQGINDNKFWYLGIESLPLPRSARRELFLVIRSPDGVAGNSVTVWMNSAYSGSPAARVGADADFKLSDLVAQASMGGEPLQGHLVVRLQGRPELRWSARALNAARKWFGAKTERRLPDADLSGARAENFPVYRKPPVPDRLQTITDIGKCKIALFQSEDPSTQEPELLKVIADWKKRGAEVLILGEEVLKSKVYATCDLVIIDGLPMSEELKTLLSAATESYVPVVYYCSARVFPNGLSPKPVCNGPKSEAPQIEIKRYEAFRACDYAVYCLPTLRDQILRERKECFAIHECLENGRDGVEALEAMLAKYKRRHLPSFSVVGVLYQKADQIEAVLESYLRQSYPGDVELILVDDRTPDDSVRRAQEYISTRTAGSCVARPPQVRFIRNERNSGNCISRSVGVREARGDIVVVIDMDCMVNRDFLLRHAEAHSFGDCDVAIGPMNIETNGEPPLRVLEEHEADPQRVMGGYLPQDRINRSSFLNCITRNFSIKRAFLTEDLFDPAFSYSEDPKSGFGWEDVEMGYRLYKAGARIKFIEDAFTIHVSHPSSGDERIKPARSLANFRKLFDKHPELLLVARRWSLDTYQKISDWYDRNGLPPNDDRKVMDERLERFVPPPFYIRSDRALRVLTYRWHPAHQYELYKLPYQFTLLSDLGSPISTGWDLSQRPLPGNVEFKSISQIDPAEYDLAVLHFDENVLSPWRTRGVTSEQWGDTFKWFRENLSLPMVAICHGTPQFYGQYDIDYQRADLMQVIEEERAKLVDYLGDVLVVTNSYQAQREWRFKKSKVIWHGFDPTEFPPATYERGILAPCGGEMIQRPHYRGYFVHRDVFEGFPKDFLPEKLYVPEPHIAYKGNQYACARYRNYVDQVRRYSVYFNPTIRSPMPRSRGEAMMCGLVNVSLQNHDVELYIKNGVNGFYSDQSGELREYLLYLMQNPRRTRKIGEAGRLLAMDIFNHDRYLAAWESTITELLGGR